MKIDWDVFVCRRRVDIKNFLTTHRITDVKSFEAVLGGYSIRIPEPSVLEKILKDNTVEDDKPSIKKLNTEVEKKIQDKSATRKKRSYTRKRSKKTQ